MDRKNNIGRVRYFAPCAMRYALCAKRCLALCSMLLASFTLLFALSSPLVAEAADKLVVKDAAGVNTQFVVTDTGRVGIGTDSPSTKLQVVADTIVGGWESVFTGNVSDAVGDNFFVVNNTLTPGIFSPVFVGELGSTALRNIDSALKFVGVIPTSLDTGTTAAVVFDAWKGTFASGSQLSNRPSFQFHSYGTYLVTILSNGNVGIGTTTPEGALDVNGAIYQRGSVLHADYVFEPTYKMESIEDHARYMWTNKHLSAVPGVRKDDNGQEIVEVGSHQRGILEELEKAHVYIEQLNKKLKDLEAKISTLEKK
ncbi:MAG: hypothetical protein WA126_14050 [Thermodesulfovibrionales bacterium]